MISIYIGDIFCCSLNGVTVQFITESESGFGYVKGVTKNFGKEVGGVEIRASLVTRSSSSW